MSNQWFLSPDRHLTETEKSLIWCKPLSHKESEEERRICREVKRNWHHKELKITNILLEGDAGSGKTQLAKSLSAHFGLPYTKVTCFADMDKSDVIGAILPVLSEKQQEALGIPDKEALLALYQSDSLQCASQLLGGPEDVSETRIKSIVKYLQHIPKQAAITYRFYPSEIVQAFQNGYLLEIQEPTVIRDAAVLMALNSALEPDGSINLPTEVIHRHPDFIAVVTTNRGYNGCRPLNEALRDRMHHTEKMDLPPLPVMVERAIAKTGYTNESVLTLLANTIILLDQTARANAIRGVAGMRSYFFWVDAVANGTSAKDSLYHKVIYKITTNPDEIVLLEHALLDKGIFEALDTVDNEGKKKTHSEVMEIHISDDGEYFNSPDISKNPYAISLRKAPDSEGHSTKTSKETQETKSSDSGEDGNPFYHKMKPTDQTLLQQKQLFRKKLNQDARQVVAGSIHHDVKLIVHRPEATSACRQAYEKIAKELMPVISELVRKTTPLLQHEFSTDFTKSQVYGTKFNADKLAVPDFRYFSKKRPPVESPTLAVALRIDESASMSAFGRLDAAKRAVVAVYEFCSQCGIPLLIYGDTADRSRLEQMSLYAYIDFESKDLDDKFSLMNIQARSNNRDGMALRILSEKLLNTPQQTKLLISISDGQPKAMPNYTGSFALQDMQSTLQEYSRKGIIFLAAAIGQDKEIISDIYGKERYLDVTDLNQLPSRLVQMIARCL